MKKLLLTTAALAVLASPAFAKDIATGPYLGLQVGYTNSDVRYKDDLLGLTMGAPGFEGGAFAGYRTVKNRVMYAVEVEGTLSNTGTTVRVDDGVDELRIKAEKRHHYAVGPRVGYLLTDSTLAFIGVDFARARFKATAALNGDSASASENRNGLRFGGGLEVAATDTFNLRLDYQHTRWKSWGDDDASLRVRDHGARVGLVLPF